MTITAINDETEYVLHMDRGEYIILMTAMGAASKPLLKDGKDSYNESVQKEIENNLHRNFDIYDKLNESIGHRK